MRSESQYPSSGALVRRPGARAPTRAGARGRTATESQPYQLPQRRYSHPRAAHRSEDAFLCDPPRPTDLPAMRVALGPVRRRQAAKGWVGQLLLQVHPMRGRAAAVPMLHDDQNHDARADNRRSLCSVGQDSWGHRICVCSALRPANNLCASFGFGRQGERRPATQICTPPCDWWHVRSESNFFESHP